MQLDEAQVQEVLKKPTGLNVEFRCIRVTGKKVGRRVYPISAYERRWPDSGGFCFNKTRNLYFDEHTKHRVIYCPARHLQQGPNTFKPLNLIQRHGGENLDLYMAGVYTAWDQKEALFLKQLKQY